MEFHFQSCVCRYHEYGEQWTTFLGEQLTCQCEVGNVTDQYAVSVKKDNGKTVGHMLNKISSMFLQHGFIITVTVTGRQIGWNIWYLRDIESRVCSN